MYTTEDLLYAWRQVVEYKDEEDVYFDSLSVRMCELVLRPLVVSIADLMNQARYQPHPTIGIRVDKEGGDFRLKEVDNVIDALVAQALLNRTGHLFEARVSDKSFGYRLDLERSETGNVFVAWTDAYQAFRRARNRVLDYPPSYHYIVTDLSNFYTSVDLNEMTRMVADVGMSESQAALWSAFIWRTVNVGEDEARGVGLPQGPAWARVMANMYLASVDQRMESAAIEYGRYVDDMFFLGVSEREAEALLADLRVAVNRMGLKINTKKTLGPTSTTDPTPLRNMNLSILSDINAAINIPGAGQATWAHILSADYLDADDPEKIANAYQSLNYVLYIASKVGDDGNVERVLDHLIYLLQSRPQKEAWIKRIFRRWLFTTEGYVDERLGDAIRCSPAYVQLLFHNELGRRDQLHETAVAYLLELLRGNPDALCAASALSVLARHRIAVPSYILARYLRSSASDVCANAITCAPLSFGEQWIAEVLASLNVDAAEPVVRAALFTLAMQDVPEDGAALLRRIDVSSCRDPLTKVLYAYCSTLAKFEPGVEWLAERWDLGPLVLEELVALLLDKREVVKWLWETLTRIGGPVPDMLIPPNRHVDHIATIDGIACYIDRKVARAYEVFVCTPNELNAINTALSQLRSDNLVPPYTARMTKKYLATVAYDMAGSELLYAVLHHKTIGIPDLTEAFRLLAESDKRINVKSFDTFRIALASQGLFQLVFVASALHANAYLGYDGELRRPRQPNLSLYGGYLVFECLTKKAVYDHPDQYLSEDRDLQLYKWHIPVIVRKAAQKRLEHRYASLYFIVGDLERACQVQEIAEEWIRRFDAHMLWVQRFEFSPESALRLKELATFHERLLKSLDAQARELPESYPEPLICLPGSLTPTLGNYTNLASLLSEWETAANAVTSITYPNAPIVVEMYWALATLLYAVVLGYALAAKNRQPARLEWIHLPPSRSVTIVVDSRWTFTLGGDAARDVVGGLNFLHSKVQASDVQKLSKLPASGLLALLTLIMAEKVELRFPGLPPMLVEGGRLRLNIVQQDFAYILYKTLAIDKALRKRNFDSHIIHSITEVTEWVLVTWEGYFSRSRLEKDRARGNDAVLVRWFGTIPKFQVANIPEADARQPYKRGVRVSVFEADNVPMVVMPPVWSTAGFMGRSWYRWQFARIVHRPWARWALTGILAVVALATLGVKGFVGALVVGLLLNLLLHYALQVATSLSGSR